MSVSGTNETSLHETAKVHTAPVGKRFAPFFAYSRRLSTTLCYFQRATSTTHEMFGGPARVKLSALHPAVACF